MKQPPDEDQNFIQYTSNEELPLFRNTSSKQVPAQISTESESLCEGFDCACPCVSLCLIRDRVALCLSLVKTPVVQENYSKYMLTKTTDL